MPRPRKYKILLSDEERTLLEKLLAEPDNDPNLNRMRCQLLLDLNEASGCCMSSQDAAEKNGIHEKSVSRLIRLFSEEGIHACIYKKRNPNSDTANQKVGTDQDRYLLELVRSDPPEGSKRWTMRALADAYNESNVQKISKDTVCRALKRLDIRL